MIEINLLPGQKRKAPGGGKLRLPNFQAVLANVTDKWLLAAIAATVLVVGGHGVMYAVNTARLNRLETDLRGVQSEKRRYDAVSAQKRQAERVRDSLSAELAIIRAIDADRFIWPHLLDEVTKALPQYTWVTQIQYVPSAPTNTTTTTGTAGTTTGTSSADSTSTSIVRVSIDGRTVDIQAYTTFLRQLAASPWITDVQPTKASTVIEQDRPVTEFNITLRYRKADSLYIRTVPLVESVR